jgi:ADP-heptose:LPS heptosyltransferase
VISLKKLPILAGQALWRVATLLISLQARTAYRLGQLLFWAMGRPAQKQDIDLSQAKRILILRLDEIGDLVMTGPFLRELRRLLPSARITLMVQPSVYNLMELCPHVDEVLTYYPGSIRFMQALLLPWRALWTAYRQLLPRQFDLAILPRWDADGVYATFLAYFSGARWRVAHSERVSSHKERVNRSFDRLCTHLLHNTGLKHEVERNLDVIRSLGGTPRESSLELWWDEDDESYAAHMFIEHNVRPNELVVGFGPSGGHSPLKQWPLASFVELGNHLYRKFDARIILFGGPGEESLGKELENRIGPPVINGIGKTTLRQAVALLRRCHLFIGNDAAPMHLAAAVGVPVVALFGASCQHRFGPSGAGHIVLWQDLPCSPCFQSEHRDRCKKCIFDRPHCMLSITVEQVEKAAESILRTRQAGEARE